MNFKKPKFWDKNKPNIYAYLLLPFALLVNLLSFLRVSRKKNKINKNVISLNALGKKILNDNYNEVLKYI